MIALQQGRFHMRTLGALQSPQQANVTIAMTVKFISPQVRAEI